MSSSAAVARHARPAQPRSARPAALTGATLVLAAAAVSVGGSAQADTQYTVRHGDTVSHIAARTGTSVEAIARANALADPGRIRAGQRLAIPSRTAAAAPATAASTTAPVSTISYTVARGDTVSAIARRLGSTVPAIVAANGLDSRAFIRAGQTLTVPAGAGAAAGSPPATSGPAVQLVGNTFAGRTYPPAVVASANANKLALLAHGVPTRAHMQSLVAETARTMGVDVSLALAVARQESGFDQSAVSPANAIGTMQVIPSSGQWAAELVGRPLDLLDPQDNVVAGVAILRSLVRTSPDLPTAIASYYQGAASVRRDGMLPDTLRYVASVQALQASSR